MSNNIDIKTLEAFQDGNHKAFETVFIAYYNKTKTFIFISEDKRSNYLA